MKKEIKMNYKSLITEKGNIGTSNVSQAQAERQAQRMDNTGYARCTGLSC